MRAISAIILLLLPLFAISQKDSLRLEMQIKNGAAQNALPPGPSRIFGTLVNKKGEAVAGAEVMVHHPNGQKRSKNVFKSDSNGSFTAYVYDYGPVELLIKLNGKTLKRIQYEIHTSGTNIGSPYEKIVLHTRRKNK
jgi:hypothetical protein